MLRKLLPYLLLLASVYTMADETVRTITVNGTGQVSALPDRASVHMSIVSRAKVLDAAQAESTAVTAAVLSLTDKLDIPRNKIDSTGATVRPDYRWNRESEEQELRGYIAERQLTVKVDNLDSLGKLVEGAVAAGVNQVSPPQLDSSRRESLHREALAMAAKDARANAEVLAETLDAKLGAPISVTDGSGAQQPPMPQHRMLGAAMESDSGATYNAGDLTFSANVTVVFELDTR